MDFDRKYLPCSNSLRTGMYPVLSPKTFTASLLGGGPRERGLPLARLKDIDSGRLELARLGRVAEEELAAADAFIRVLEGDALDADGTEEEVEVAGGRVVLVVAEERGLVDAAVVIVLRLVRHGLDVQADGETDIGHGEGGDDEHLALGADAAAHRRSLTEG